MSSIDDCLIHTISGQIETFRADAGSLGQQMAISLSQLLTLYCRDPTGLAADNIDVWWMLHPDKEPGLKISNDYAIFFFRANKERYALMTQRSP